MTREEALQILDTIPTIGEQVDALEMAIKALEQEPCSNCIEFKRYAKEMGFEIKQEPCEDCISRQAVQDYIAKYLSQYLYNDVREAVEVIDEYIGELPLVTSKPKTDVLDKIRAEIEKQEKWLLQAGYTAYNVDIALDAIKAIVAESEDKG